MTKTGNPTTQQMQNWRFCVCFGNAGPSTVRQVHEILSEIRPTVYTTILKLMQIMDDKGLVRRDKSQRAHIYQPAFTEAETQKGTGR